MDPLLVSGRIRTLQHHTWHPVRVKERYNAFASAYLNASHMNQEKECRTMPIGPCLPTGPLGLLPLRMSCRAIIPTKTKQRTSSWNVSGKLLRPDARYATPAPPTTQGGGVHITSVTSDGFNFAEHGVPPLPDTWPCGLSGVPDRFFYGYPYKGPFTLSVKFHVSGPLGIGMPFAKATIKILVSNAGIGEPTGDPNYGWQTCYTATVNVNAMGNGEFKIPITGPGYGYCLMQITAAIATMKLGQTAPFNAAWSLVA